MTSMRIAFALTLIAATPLQAQALKGFNTNSPVDFAADRIEVQDRAGRVIVSGNAQVRQGGLSLDAARMSIAYSGAMTGGNPTVQRIDASGGVFVRSATENARGDYAIYDVNRRLITMLGSVTLNQGANTVHGGRLIIDLTSGRSVIDGAAVGDGTPGVTGTRGGRVTGRFTVPQRTQ